MHQKFGSRCEEPVNCAGRGRLRSSAYLRCFTPPACRWPRLSMKHLLLSCWLLLIAGHICSAQSQPAPRLVPFRQGAKWGYADQHRRLVLPLRYDEAGPFVDELAWVRQGQRYGYIDGAGNPITPVQFTRAGNFSQGRATVELNGETFDIGPGGRRLTEPTEPAPETDYLEQGDLVRQNGKVGFRFSVGQAVVPAEYDEIRDNYNGLLFVRQGQHWGVLNSKGKQVQPVQFDAIQTKAANGDALILPIVVKNGRYGYLDEQGKLLVEPQYQEASPFVAGVARVVTQAGQPGYINTNGVEFFD